MDEHPGDDAADLPRPDEPLPVPRSLGFVPPVPEGPAADALTAEREQLRARIDAGAGSPEELRALAAQLREVRQREEQLWRAEVRPALVKARKGRLRPPPSASAIVPDEPTPGARSLGLGLAVLGAVVVVLVLATQSSALWVLLPVAAVLVYAWRQGSRPPDEAPATDDAPDP
jgi:hypothetical protein